MANYLILNQTQVWNGLGTLSYTVPTTGNYHVQYQVTFPEALAQGSGAGSNKGLGAGTGGGAQGFVLGDRGAGYGGVGQGFGTGNNYQQPPAAPSNQTEGTAVSSALVVLVKKNGVTQYTAPVPTVTQSAFQFKFGFQASATDAITVVLSSVNASDNALNGVCSNVSIGQGLL